LRSIPVPLPAATGSAGAGTAAGPHTPIRSLSRRRLSLSDTADGWPTSSVAGAPAAAAAAAAASATAPPAAVTVEFDLGGGVAVFGDFALDIYDASKAETPAAAAAAGVAARMGTIWLNTRFLAAAGAAAAAAVSSLAFGANSRANEELLTLRIPLNKFDLVPEKGDKMRTKLLSDAFLVEIEGTFVP
jgi:hypothetical protein